MEEIDEHRCEIMSENVANFIFLTKYLNLLESMSPESYQVYISFAFTFDS